MQKINRLYKLDKIFELTQKIKKEYGFEPYNLSNWQISEYYENYILGIMQFKSLKKILSYQYTYTFDKCIYDSLKEKLCVAKDQEIMITSNNTLSILLVSNFLKQIKCKKICIVAPSYFSTYECLNLLDIPFDKLYLNHTKNNYKLPSHDVLEKYDYIWLTSPAFSSSVYLDIDDIKILKKLQNNDKMIICDEAYSYISKKFSSNNLIPDISIVCPHKPLNINSFKFSAIIYNKKYNDIFIHWSDIIHGNLNISSVEAVHHFLSKNYQICLNENQKFIKNAFNKVKNILNKYNNFYIDESCEGNMIMIYNKKINYNVFYKKDFLEKLILNTNGFILPAYFHDYDESYGFCFRINLCLYDNKKFLTALDKVLYYLSNSYE